MSEFKHPLINIHFSYAFSSAAAERHYLGDVLPVHLRAKSVLRTLTEKSSSRKRVN